MGIIGIVLLLIGIFFTFVGYYEISRKARQESFFSLLMVIFIPPYLFYYAAARRAELGDPLHNVIKGAVFLFITGAFFMPSISLLVKNFIGD